MHSYNILKQYVEMLHFNIAFAAATDHDKFH